MATPPTLSVLTSAVNVGTSPKTLSVTVAAGDVLTVAAVVENNGATIAAPTGGTGLTWTPGTNQTAGAGMQAGSYIWTATSPSAQSFTLSVARASGDAGLWWGYAFVGASGSDGVGAPAGGNNGTSSTAPSVDITTTQANSAIVVVCADWNAAAGTATYRTGAGAVTSRIDFRDAAHYTARVWTHADSGAINTYALGMTAPNQRWALTAVEIKGAAGGGGSTVNGVAAASFGFTATVAGIPRVRATTNDSFGFVAQAIGKPRKLAVVVASFGFTATANGINRVPGTASGSFGFTSTATGTVRHLGAISTNFGFLAEALGFPGAAPVAGNAVASFGFVATASGSPRVQGQAVAAFGFVATANGVPRANGLAVTSFGFVASATGIPRAVSQAMGDFGFVAFIVGTTRRLGATSTSFGFVATASGGVPGVSDIYLLSSGGLIALATRSAVAGSWVNSSQTHAQSGAWA